RQPDPAAPAEPVPTRKRRPAQPPPLLPNRHAELGREMAAADNDPALASAGRDAHEDRPQSQRADPQAHLIILGHAGPGERLALLRRGEANEGRPGDRAADPGERDCRADGFADHQLLDVLLGEFVAIMTADP